MKERRRGTIITIGSAAGRRAHPRSPIPYAAAKAGIALLTQDVAAQAGPFGIRVNCITPETILTEGDQEQIPAELQASLADAHPLKRLGTPRTSRPPPRISSLTRPPGSPAWSSTSPAGPYSSDHPQ